MANVLVDERDIKFVLYEQLELEKLCETEKFSEYNREMFDMVLEAGRKLAENELLPINPDGDQQGVCWCSTNSGNGWDSSDAASPFPEPHPYHRMY